jgi:hypothetical protein
MIKFIWNSWWRNKERFILLIIGMLLMSVGLSYLVGVTQSNNGTIINELQKRWKSSYHLVVRPPDSRSVTEDLKLLEPNYLSGLHGGISLEQYETIKGMDDVEIAAPISMIGSVFNNMNLGKINVSEPGIYRMKTIETVDTGASEDIEEGAYYFTVGGWDPMSAGRGYGVGTNPGDLSYGTEILVAGIDPEQEAELVGLDGAIVPGDASRYFKIDDKPEELQTGDDLTETEIPVIMSNREFIDGKIEYVIEKLELPFEAAEQSETMEMVKERGGEKYLDSVKGSPVEEHLFTTGEAHEKLVKAVMNPGYTTSTGDMKWMAFKPSPVEYRPVTSPFRDRWAFSYEVTPYDVPEDSFLPISQSYRKVNMFGENSAAWPRLRLDYIGIFNPQKLNISKDPLTELPVETYFPSKASLVLNEEEEPVNPPKEMKPVNNPYGFLTKPPLMLTTIEAAANIIGEDPISSIRVNVKGVETFNEESEAVLQKVAKQIEEKTGLIVDVTLGSSPQPALTHIPGIEGKESIGWAEQPWIKIGSSMTIFNEAKLGISGVVGSVVAVAIVYVFSSNLIMMYGRKKEFAVYLALGWRPGQLSKLLMLEATLLGLAVSGISWLILGWFMVSSGVQTSGLRLFLVGLLGLLIYWLGSLLPAVLVRKIRPYETMKTGEISTYRKRIVKSESLPGMVLNGLLSKWKRTSLSVFSIGLPTGMLLFFLFITFRLKGVMFTTWLGQYVAMEVSAMHYVAMGIALSIAVLTTAEIIWQNVTERQAEIAVLKAIGWHNATIRSLVMMEGAICGIFAGIFGLGCAFILIYTMYGGIPYGQLWLYVLTMLIPMITGVIASFFPAHKAAAIPPYQGLSGGVENSKNVEKKFRYILSAAGMLLLIGIGLLLTQVISNVKEHTETAATQTPHADTGTEGASVESYEKKKEPVEEAAEEKGDSLLFSGIKERAWRKAILGETIYLADEHYHFGKLVKTPESVKKPKKDQRLITVPVEAEINISSISEQLNLNIFELIDQEDHHYKTVDVQIPLSENWKAGRISSPGKLAALLTFEVPEDKNHFILQGGKANTPGPFAVEIMPEHLQEKREAYSRGLHLGKKTEATADYNLEVSLQENGTISVNATIIAFNQSMENWEELGFYFIPNALADKAGYPMMESAAEIDKLQVESVGKPLDYHMEGAQLRINLDEEIPPGEKKWIKITYNMKLPEKGVRFSKQDDNYFLAQWYPMLADYENGWELHPFDAKGESYHTNYGSFTVNYKLPKEYIVVSSGVDGELVPSSEGEIETIKNVKDFYLAFLSPGEWASETVKANSGIVTQTDLRLLIPKNDREKGGKMITLANEAFEHFSSSIGSYPFAELDLIGNAGNMEYPNVVEVTLSEENYEHTIVHELAHQWFYYMVSNDPYEDAWLDEGLTELAASIFLTDYHENEAKGFSFARELSETNAGTQAVNIPLKDFSDDYIATVYGKVPLLLHDFFLNHGGKDTEEAFLKSYFQEFQFNHVDSKIFAEFFENYFEGNQQEFLNQWLELEE